MKDYPELQVSIFGSGSTLDRLEFARRGDTDIFTTTSDFVSAAYYGTGDYKGKAIPDIRGLYFTRVTATTFFVTKKSGVTSIEQLTGKSFGVQQGSGLQTQAKQIFDVLGITPKWDLVGSAALVEAVQAGRTIGYARSGAPEAGVVQIASREPITILGFTQEQIAKGNAAYPGTYMPVNIPAGTYPGQDKDVLTFGYVAGEATLKGVSEDVVYKWVKAIYNHREEIAKSAGALSVSYRDILENTLKYEPVPFHPGAVKFYKELGRTIPSNMLPPN